MINLRAIPPYALAALVPLALAPGMLDPSTYPKLAGACALITFALPLALLSASPRPGAGSSALRNPVLIALSIFAALQILALFHSPLLSEGLWTLLLRLLPAAVALMVYRLASGFPEAMRDLSRAAVAGLLAQSLIGGLQYFDLAFQALPGSGYLPQGTLANKNVLAAWLAMGLPLAAYALGDASKAWRRAALAAFAAAVFIMVVSHSRNAWLVLALFMAAGLMGARLLRGIPEFSKTGVSRIRTALLTASAAISLAVLWDSTHPPAHLAYRAAAGFGGFGDRLSSVVQPFNARNAERLELWQRTLAMTASRPMLGAGPGSWKLAYPSFGTRPVNPDPGMFPASPHNDYLLIASESGVPGALAYLLVFGAAVFILVGRLRGSQVEARSGFGAICLLASLGAYLADAASNFPGDRVEPAVLLGLILGTAALAHGGSMTGPMGSLRLTVTDRGRRGRMPDLAVAGLALAGLVFCLLRWDAEAHLRRGLEARDRLDWRTATRELASADRPWHRLDRTGTPAAFYRAMAELGGGSRERALGSLREAHSINPSHIHVINALGSLNVSYGRFDEGIGWYEKSLALRPDFREARTNLAAAWFNKGRWRKAGQVLAAIPPEERDTRAAAYGQKVNELLKEQPGHE